MIDTTANFKKEAIGDFLKGFKERLSRAATNLDRKSVIDEAAFVYQ